MYTQSKYVDSFFLIVGPVYSPTGMNSKGNVVFSAELARRYGDQGVVSTSIHPGNTSLPYVFTGVSTNYLLR